MAQGDSSKEISGNKMVKIIIGTILVASIIIVVIIQAFYMFWEPKEPKQIKQDETEQPSYSKSAMVDYVELLHLG